MIENEKNYFSILNQKIIKEAPLYGYIHKFGQIYAILYINEIFYVNSITSGNLIKGKLFKTSYDINHNPNFLIQEGSFQIEINEGIINYYLVDDNGIEYQQKSKQIKYQGKFIKGRYTELLYDYESINHIKIIDNQTGIELNKSNNQQQIDKSKKNQQYWIKYNQQFIQKDLQTLEPQSKDWVKSSMLDAYCNYLNLQSQIKYFDMAQDQRFQIDRIHFVPSSLITSFGNFSEAQKLCKQEFLEFEGLEYKLDIMYKYVGFIVNINNAHWILLNFDLQNGYYEIFGGSVSNKIIIELVKFLRPSLPIMNNELKEYKLQSFQKDSYSCGLRVANFMKYRFEKQFEKDLKLSYDEQLIKSILYQTIKQNSI